MSYNSKVKKGHRRLFYSFIFILSIVLVFVSTFDIFPENTRIDKIFETITLDFSAALLLIAALFGLKRFAVLNEEAEETLQKVKENSDALHSIKDNSIEIREAQNAILSGFHEQITSSNNSWSYTERTPYYKKYYTLVSNAKKTVKLIGDGFGCHSAQNEERAMGLYNAMDQALQNGVTLSRFQYHNTLSLKWLNLLLELKCIHGDKFKLFMHKDCDPTVLPYVICLTDPNETSASINIMFTMNADTTMAEKLGGPAFVFEKSSDCAVAMVDATKDFFDHSHSISKEQLKQLISSQIGERRQKIKAYIAETADISRDETAIMQIAKKLCIPDIELIDSCLALECGVERELYFSFGSNLLDRRIRHKNRAPSAICIDRGFLENHQMCFNMTGNLDQGAGGGIANIVPKNNSRVYGAIYLIDKVHLDQLQEREESMGYKTEIMEINKGAFGKISAKVFLSPDATNAHITPNKEYADLIMEGMKQNLFPEEYQTSIQSLMSK